MENKNVKDCHSWSFRGLMVAQALDAFNDNAFKVLISFLVIHLLSPAAATQAISFIGALFIIPFIVFSPYAGFFADRFKKRNVIVITKCAEILIMSLGLVALKMQHLPFIFLVLFLTMTHSAFFSPAKYGILPEILDNEHLSKGNGYLQMWTFLAIILGSAFGGQMSHIFHDHIHYASYVLIASAGIGAVAGLLIDKNGPHDSSHKFEINSLKESFSALQEIKRDRWLFLTFIAICYFWFMGAVFQMNVLLYGKEMLHMTDSQASLLLVMTSVGIGAGSVFAGLISEKKVEYGLVPLGAIGMSLFSLWIGLSHHSIIRSFMLFVCLGFFSGVYIVPLNAYFQSKSPQNRRGKFLAASNIVTSACILLGSVYVWLFGAALHFNPAHLFFLLGLLSVGITIFTLKTLPEAFVRLLNFILAHFLYRIKVVGVENVPKEGGALLVCNHISYADPTLILAAAQRPIRFLMLREIYENRVIKPVADAMNVIPISQKDGPKGIMRALLAAREAIQQGHLVCIFSEAAHTRHGNMLPFLHGFERIMNGLEAPIIPMHLDRMWGSIFSFENGKYFWKWPKVWPYPATVSFGQPMAPSTKAYQVRLAVQELSAEAFKLRGGEQKKLHIAFIDEVKKTPFKFCMADSAGHKLNYLEALTSVTLLSRKLFSNEPSDGEKVGVLLPASTAGSLINGAVFFAGKVPVNLNFTASKESLLSCVEQCQMKRIISSRIFLKKAKLEERNGMIFVEDLIKEISQGEKRKTFLVALLFPAWLLKMIFVKGDRTNVNDLATIIFSSGSTGQPKGVMLSHANIFSNIEGFYQVLKIQNSDVVLGVLPFFHSFGFTATLCLPVGVGLSVVYHSNPLDAGTIGELAKKYKATVIMGTPTFFSAYIRKCSKEEFASLRFAVAGAEKLKKSLADAFYEKFGIRPYEGYGATELSPVVSMTFPDYIDEERRIHQIGYKEGKVGHPIPGVAVKVIDSETGEILPVDKEGLLMVKGPNVMMGYLNNPEKTAEVIRDGWYITGDIATIDGDGFICITDRLSRFSKIGGEMVPHVKIEEKILEILDSVEPLCAVTSVADDRRGERLVVLCSGQVDTTSLWEKLNATDFPKLWIPKKEDFYQVAEIPILGSGKLDLKKIKTIANELAAAKESKDAS